MRQELQGQLQKMSVNDFFEARPLAPYLYVTVAHASGVAVLDGVKQLAQEKLCRDAAQPAM